MAREIADIKKFWETKEREILSPFATLSTSSRGRERKSQNVSYGIVFREIEIASFTPNLSAPETQKSGFLSPEGDHYRTRLTHTLK